MLEHATRSSPSVLPSEQPLRNCRVIGLLNNTEVFGQERANIEVFNSLRRQGAEVMVGLNRKHDGGALRARVEQNGFQTFALPFGCQWSKAFFRTRPSLVLTNLAAIASCSRGLARQVESLDATVIHLGNPLVYSYIAPYLSYNKQIQLVYRMGDEPPHASRPNMWVWHRCIRRADFVVANSHFVKSSIVRASPHDEQRIKLIYNVAPGDATTPHDHTYLKTSDSLRVLYVGQIAEHKGVSHFVDCAIELAKQDNRWHFDVVGGSEYTKELEQELKKTIVDNALQNRIVLHGNVADPTPFYLSALVLVVPSLFDEPAANVVLEAKRLGIPAIVYPSGGLPELISDGATGFLCSAKDKSILLKEISSCLREPQIPWQMRARCLAEYSDRFSMARFDRDWCKIYSGTCR